MKIAFIYRHAEICIIHSLMEKNNTIDEYSVYHQIMTSDANRYTSPSRLRTCSSVTRLGWTGYVLNGIIFGGGEVVAPRSRLVTDLAKSEIIIIIEDSSLKACGGQKKRVQQ